MFKIIGADGREYGPVDEATIRRWIAENRANAQTRVQAEGATEWTPLAEVAVFAAALAAGAAAPPPPPPSPAAPRGSAEAAREAQDLLARDLSLDVFGCVGRGWDLVQNHFWETVAAWGIVLIIGTAVGLIPYVGFPASILLACVFHGGLYWFFLKKSRGLPANIGDAFSGFSGVALGQLLLLGVVSTLLWMTGLLFCILPGLYLMVAWWFAAVIVLDRNLDFWAAMELSRRVVTRNLFGVVALLFVGLLLYFVGLLACCIGLLVTGPIVTASLVEAYRDLFERRGAPAA